MSSPNPEIPSPTLLLRHAADGSETAQERLLALVWQELRGIASSLLRNERIGHTLQPTALVHEAYMRLIDTEGLAVGERELFLGIAARAMRRVLIDHARKRRRLRRGGDAWQRVELGVELLPDIQHDVDLLEIDEVLKQFAEVDERASRVVELRFFGGLSVDEIAAVLGVSDRTVDNDWFAARAWLSRALSEGKKP